MFPRLLPPPGRTPAWNSFGFSYSLSGLSQLSGPVGLHSMESESDTPLGSLCVGLPSLQVPRAVLSYSPSITESQEPQQGVWSPASVGLDVRLWERLLRRGSVTASPASPSHTLHFHTHLLPGTCGHARHSPSSVTSARNAGPLFVQMAV